MSPALALAPAQPPRLALALLGTGQVGSALLHQLAEGEERGESLRIVSVANSRRTLLDREGIRPREAVARLWAEGTGPAPEAPLAALQQAGADVRVIVDATAAQQVAARHADWLAQGVHVVSANKLAAGGTFSEWQALGRGAEIGNSRYGDAATVGAGLPALSTLRRLRRAGDELVELAGVFSGSLSFLFNSWDGSVPFSSLLAEARQRGYTEPDPRADLCGRDVARKLLIVARAAGECLEETDIEVEDLVPQALRDLPLDAFLAQAEALDEPLEARRRKAAASGQVLRYLARLRRGERATVRLEAVAPGHPCAQLSGADNLFAFTTLRYCQQPLVVRGPGAGPEVTAQALLADVLEIAL